MTKGNTSRGIERGFNTELKDDEPSLNAHEVSLSARSIGGMEPRSLKTVRPASTGRVMRFYQLIGFRVDLIDEMPGQVIAIRGHPCKAIPERGHASSTAPRNTQTMPRPGDKGK